MTGAKDQRISQESSYFLPFTSAFCYAGSVFRHILMSGRKHVSQDVWACERSLAFKIAGVRMLLSSSIYSSIHSHSTGLIFSLMNNLKLVNRLRRVKISVVTIFIAGSSALCSKKQKALV